MATQLGQGQQLDSQGQAQQHPGAKGDIAPVLQQLNMTSLRARTQGLHTSITRILQAFHANPPTKWSEVLGQFAMVNVELLNLVDDIKPILKMYVVYPKNVNAENAQMLPIMLSSKLLPEMESEEAAMKEQILAGIANLPGPLQTEKLQRQIEAVRSACDVAEKVITEARKVYGLGTRPGPVSVATLDKLHLARINEQEKLLRAATNFGEGLRIPGDQHQQSTILPSHLSAAFATTRDGRPSTYPGADGGYFKTSAPVLPPTGLRSNVQQQANQVSSRVQTPTQSTGTGGGGAMTGSSTSQLPYMVNSPRSGGNNFNVSSPQQSQTQQSQAAFLQRTKVHQQQQQLQRQQLQLQHQQQQQQQLRHPSTPPIPQVGGQLQSQVAQPLLQQQKQQLQQQSQLTQHQQQQLMQQQVLQIQERHAMQVSQQQQNLQQQLQSSQLQGAQNTVQPTSQVRTQMGQQGSPMSNLYGSGTQNLLTSNVMGSMSQPVQSQTLLQQRLHQYQQGNLGTNQLSANQPKQNPSSMLSDSWTGTQLPQNSSNVGLPLQQQQLPQPNYMNMFNNPAQANFGQHRQQQPPS